MMEPGEARDLIFAGAGILWCAVTIYRAMREWMKQKQSLKHMIVIVVGFFLFGSAVRAEQAGLPAPLSAHLKTMALKLDHAAQRANQPSSVGSSVIGLRGTQQEPLSKQLYWKDREIAKPVTVEEVKGFRSAVEQAKAGRLDEAKASLQDLLAKFPASPLKPDIEDTLKLLEPAPSSEPATPKQESL